MPDDPKKTELGFWGWPRHRSSGRYVPAAGSIEEIADLWEKKMRRRTWNMRLGPVSRFIPSNKALAVMAWLIVAFVLAVVAFGSRPFLNGGSLLVSLAHSRDAGRVTAFAGLGLLVLFGAVWFWREIRNRHTLEDVGIVLTCAGIAGFLVLLGGYVLKIDLGERATMILWLGSPALLFGGLRIYRENPTPQAPPSVPLRGRAYHRKQVTTHGDARSADDWEIDRSLRDKSGGFDPMFKD